MALRNCRPSCSYDYLIERGPIVEKPGEIGASTELSVELGDS